MSLDPYDNGSGDTPIWSWKSKDMFTVKSTYRHFVDGGTRIRSGQLIWRLRYPLKVRFFMWLIEKETIIICKKGNWWVQIIVLCAKEMERMVNTYCLTVRTQH